MVRGIAWTAMTAAVALVVASNSARAQTCAAPSAANQACTASCATLVVGNGQGSPGGNAVAIPIQFTQGPDDGTAGQGNDDVAALAFTVGIPGTGTGAPLIFDCTDGNLASTAVQVGSGIADNFSVVVENAQCTNRSRCLCPGDGQTRDNFVNIVVYGPKTLPEQGPVDIPVLPDTGTIVTLNLKVAGGTPAGDIPLHVFAATDNGTPEKPQFAANASIGDQAACDVTGDAQSKSRIGFTDGKVTVTGVTPMPNGCVGDCNGNGTVAINELVVGVNIALGNAQVSGCTSFDKNANGGVEINELVQGVNNALNGCPA